MQTLIETPNSCPPGRHAAQLLKIPSESIRAHDMVGTGAAKAQERDDMKEMASCIRAVADRGDREAFRELFAFYAPRLKAFLIKRGASPDEAQEVMQEAMTLVWRKASQFDPAKASASTWI